MKYYGKDSFEATSKLPQWDEAAIAYMKAHPNADGSIGYMLTTGPHVDEWIRYFKSKGLKAKASFCRMRTDAGQSYMVPTMWPDQYDSRFRRRGTSWADRSQPKDD